ncbi:MAG: hypothetical protein OXH38_06685 [Chloroflexi bacterium]|nr:hypothetical protein [Chloroflexota bacterium]
MRFGLPATAALVVALWFNCFADSGEPLSLVEYADVCAESITLADPPLRAEEVTWGFLRESLKSSLEKFRSATPPEVLSDFHRASIKGMEYMLSVSEEHRSDEQANPLALGIEGARIAYQIGQAFDELPDDVRRTLRAAGCL